MDKINVAVAATASIIRLMRRSCFFLFFISHSVTSFPFDNIIIAHKYVLVKQKAHKSVRFLHKSGSCLHCFAVVTCDMIRIDFEAPETRCLFLVLCDWKVRWLARSPNEQVVKAKELFDSGKSLIEIAEILKVSAGTVRSWKSRYGWDKSESATLQKKVQRCKKEKRNVAKADAKTVESVMENTELTAEQQLFCILYAKTLNATQSYMKAYGCSYESAMTNSFRLLRNDRVKAEIQRLKKERFESQLFDEHDVFQWYLDIATASITDFVTFGRKEIQAMGAFGPITDKKTGAPVMREVNYVDFRESGQVDGRVIKKVKMGKDGASIELYDAMKAMEWLADHMAMGTGNQQKLAETIIGAYERRQKEMKGDEENASTEQ